MTNITQAAKEMQANHDKFTAVLGQGGTGNAGWTHDVVLQLSGWILAFATVTLILATILLWRQRAEAGQVLRVFGIVFIVAVTTMMVIVGYSSEQLTPVIGLFGAIAGYLLGRDPARRADSQSGG